MYSTTTVSLAITLGLLLLLLLLAAEGDTTGVSKKGLPVEEETGGSSGTAVPSPTSPTLATDQDEDTAFRDERSVLNLRSFNYRNDDATLHGNYDMDESTLTEWGYSAKVCQSIVYALQCGDNLDLPIHTEETRTCAAAYWWLHSHDCKPQEFHPDGRLKVSIKSGLSL